MPVPAIVAGAAAVAGRVAAKKVAKEVAKKATKKAAEKIAKNSVKVKPANKGNPSNKKNNDFTDYALRIIKSGQYAKDQAKLETVRNNLTQGLNKTKPKVVQVNSAAKAKSPDAAKSANAKALKAANKKGKK